MTSKHFQKSDAPSGSLNAPVFKPGAYWIEILDGLDKGKRVPLDSDTRVIGRDNSVDIYLRDVEVSRRHAHIQHTPSGFLLIDLDSSNGTFVDERPIREHQLAIGQMIRIGQTRLLFGQTDPTEIPGACLSSQRVAWIDANLTEWDCQVMTIRQALVTSASGNHLLNQQTIEQLDNVMRDVIIAVSGVSELSELLERILDLVIKRTDAKRGCILLLDDARESIEYALTRHATPVATDASVAINRSLFKAVCDKQAGILATLQESTDNESFPSSLQTPSMICVPIAALNRLNGLIYIDTGSKILGPPDPKRNCLSPESLRFTMLMGYYAFSSVENARLHATSLQQRESEMTRLIGAKLSDRIKNIVHGMGGGGRLIEEGLRSEVLENVGDGWRLIRKYLEKTNDLTRNLDIVASDIQPEMNIGNVNDIVAEVVNLLRKLAAETGVLLNWEATTDLPPVKFSADLLKIAIFNLVINGIDACRRADLCQVEIRTILVKNDNVVRVVIADNGEGIPPERQAEIFELFSSTRGSMGIGLGLPVSLQIARAHGGNIEVTSQPGKGSQFHLVLPIEPEKTGDTVHGE